MNACEFLTDDCQVEVAILEVLDFANIGVVTCRGQILMRIIVTL